MTCIGTMIETFSVYLESFVISLVFYMILCKRMSIDVKITTAMCQCSCHL